MEIREVFVVPVGFLWYELYLGNSQTFLLTVAVGWSRQPNLGIILRNTEEEEDNVLVLNTQHPPHKRFFVIVYIF